MDENRLKPYDRVMGSLDGMPDVVKSRPSPVRVTTPIVGTSETFIIQTFRSAEGDTVFIEHTGPETYERYFLPPAAVRVILRQRDGLEAQNRKKAGRALAAERKAAGIEPAFLRGRGKASR